MARLTTWFALDPLALFAPGLDRPALRRPRARLLPPVEAIPVAERDVARPNEPSQLIEEPVRVRLAFKACVVVRLELVAEEVNPAETWKACLSSVRVRATNGSKGEGGVEDGDVVGASKVGGFGARGLVTEVEVGEVQMFSFEDDMRRAVV